MIHSNKFGEIKILEDKEYFQDKVISLAMSGGADSTLLCYLIAKAIHDGNMNTAIWPMNGYDISLPHDSLKLIKVIEFINNRFPEVDLKYPISVVFDGQGEDVKNDYLRPLRDTLCKQGAYDIWMVGINQGPTLEIQKKEFPTIKRLAGHTLSEQLLAPELNAPFVNQDKRFIVQCYKDLGLLDLYHTTSSCTQSDPGCNECWFCHERAWAEKEVLE
jgi:hypothetical protein